ncbi:MAG: hypothetical protein V8S24_09455 [Gordonibacter pamelaeae]
MRLARASPHQAAPGVVVRDGTAEIEVARGQVLDFRLEPDEGVSVESVSVGGEDAAGRLGADGVLTLAAEDARVELEVVFGPAAPAGGSAGAAGPRGGLARTGDLPGSAPARWRWRPSVPTAPRDARPAATRAARRRFNRAKARERIGRGPAKSRPPEASNVHARGHASERK